MALMLVHRPQYYISYKKNYETILTRIWHSVYELRETKEKKKKKLFLYLSSGTTTIETLTLLLPPVSTPLTKTTTTTMFSSRPASSGKTFNEN